MAMNLWEQWTGRLLCARGYHDLHAITAVVSGSGLRYAAPTNGYIIIRKVCVRPGCRHQEDVSEICAIILQKPKVVNA
jgi:hypothetical protein